MQQLQKTGEREGVARYVSSFNGLEILLKQDHSAPVVSFLVLYRVGSRNEAVGHTGATHMLEHMLFKGTPEMNRERGTQIAAMLEQVGADFNATTWCDRTNYFETVPSDQLELAIRIEADRMRNSFISDEDRQSEMTVVRNELERGENEPLNVMDIQAHATAFREHPYHHPTIGWHADVEGVPTARLKEFYDTFYWPDNATIVIVGDFETSAAIALVETYFGGIPRAPRALPGVYTREPEQQGERRFVVHRTGPDGIVLLSFRSPEAADPDTATLAVIGAMLGKGRSSRLYRALVDTQLASEASATAETFRDPGLFQIYATTMPDVPHALVERRLLESLERLRTERVPDAEIEKARRLVHTELVFRREGATNFGYELSEAVSSVHWQWFFDYPESVARVTPDDVQRVARAIFRTSQLTTGWFVPTRVDDEAGLLATVREDGDAPATTEPEEPTGAEAEPGRVAGPVAAIGRARSNGPVATAFGDRARRAVLDNGAVVVALEHRADPTVAIRAHVRAGAWYAGDERLLADIAARMLRRGTARRSAFQFAEDLESLGAAVGVSAGAFAVDVRAHALAEDAATVLAALAEMLREPVFPEAELDKVKAEVAAEIRQQQDSTTDRAFERLTQLTLPRKHPYFEPPASELLAELESITTGRIRDFYAAHYTGAALSLAVVGDVSSDDVLAAAATLFGDWPGARPGEIALERIEPVPGRRDVVRMDDKANADVAIGLAARLRRRDPDYLAAAIGNAVLGQSTLSSRLGVRVRDREGLTYGISSRFLGATLVDGLWVTSVTVQPANVERAIASTLDEIGRTLADGVTTAEVDALKSNFAGTFKVGLATNAGIAGHLLDAEFYEFGPGYLDAFPGEVALVTHDDVNAALRRHIILDRLVTVIAGDVAS